MRVITLFLILSLVFSQSQELDKQARVAGVVRQFEIYPTLKVNFCWVPPGTFKMGSPESEIGRDFWELEDRILIKEGFWLAETECTQEQWESPVSGFQFTPTCLPKRS